MSHHLSLQFTFVLRCLPTYYYNLLLQYGVNSPAIAFYFSAMVSPHLLLHICFWYGVTPLAIAFIFLAWHQPTCYCISFSQYNSILSSFSILVWFPTTFSFCFYFYFTICLYPITDLFFFGA